MGSDDGSAGNHEYTTSPVGAPTNKWVHLVATIKRKGRMRLYVNGVEKSNYDMSKYAAGSLNSFNSMTFGCVHNQGMGGRASLRNYVEHRTGSIDEAGMWGRVLTTAEIKT